MYLCSHSHLPNPIMCDVPYPRFPFLRSYLSFDHWNTVCVSGCNLGNALKQNVNVEYDEDATNVCSLCRNAYMLIRHGTTLLLQTLYDDYACFTKGSNVATINLAKGTSAWSARCLREWPRGENGAQRLLRHRQVLDVDFPGLNAASSLPSNAHVYATMMTFGGNACYTKLSELYRGAMGLSSSSSSHAILLFVLLCFHLGKQYDVSSSVVTRMWSDTLRRDSMVTLIRDIWPYAEHFSYLTHTNTRTHFAHTQSNN